MSAAATDEPTNFCLSILSGHFHIEVSHKDKEIGKREVVQILGKGQAANEL